MHRALYSNVRLADRLFRQSRTIGSLALGGNAMRLAAVVQSQPEVVPDDASGDVSCGDGGRHFIGSRLEQSGVELLDVLLRTRVGVITQGVGRDRMDRASDLSVDSDGKAALRRRTYIG